MTEDNRRARIVNDDVYDSRGHYVVPKWLIEDYTISGDAKWLYIFLRDYAGDSGKAWPSHDTLATKIHNTRFAVIRLMKELVSCGLIVIEKGGRGCTNTYHIQSPTSRLAPLKVSYEGPKGSHETRPACASDDVSIDDVIEQDVMSDDVTHDHIKTPDDENGADYDVSLDHTNSLNIRVSNSNPDLQDHGPLEERNSNPGPLGGSRSLPQGILAVQGSATVTQDVLPKNGDDEPDPWDIAWDDDHGPVATAAASGVVTHGGKITDPLHEREITSSAKSGAVPSRVKPTTQGDPAVVLEAFRRFKGWREIAPADYRVLERLVLGRMHKVHADTLAAALSWYGADPWVQERRANFSLASMLARVSDYQRWIDDGCPKRKFERGAHVTTDPGSPHYQPQWSGSGKGLNDKFKQVYWACYTCGTSLIQDGKNREEDSEHRYGCAKYTGPIPMTTDEGWGDEEFA